MSQASDCKDFVVHSQCVKFCDDMREQRSVSLTERVRRLSLVAVSIAVRKLHATIRVLRVFLWAIDGFSLFDPSSVFGLTDEPSQGGPTTVWRPRFSIISEPDTVFTSTASRYFAVLYSTVQYSTVLCP